ncbi:MAG: aminoglycoside phosphotransferase family protein, partial [Acidobacteria bacterium]|nr:aminoglycoside phosphotransferase family protein [Acidobacteriota bacterium]
MLAAQPNGKPSEAAILGYVTKTDSYRLVVFNRGGTTVLLESCGSGYDLPLVSIPRFTRPAQEITTLVRGRWQIPSVLLFSNVLEENADPVYSAVLEAQVRTFPPPEGMDWFPVHHAISHLLKGKSHSILEDNYLKSANGMAGQEPFSRLGWLSHLQDWVRTVIRPLGTELNDFQQLNGSETFSLIRFDTTHQPVWFKAVGKPNLHEFPITLALAELFPEYMPSLLDTQPTCHGWLMADAGGPSLDELEDCSAWKSAAAALGALQIESIGKTTGLLEAGCKDLRISKLLALVDPFLDVIADLMTRQTKIPPPILSREELSELSATLKNALQSLASLRIPDTLGHSDFNPGNIVVGRERCVFIDWAEAHVGHPLLTFEYFLAHLRKDYPQLVPFESDFRASYSHTWSLIASPEQVAESFLFSPLVAVYAYAVSSGVWRDPERLKVSGVQGYLRSLTRRMKQEA